MQTPSTYIIGYTGLDHAGIYRYLVDTDQKDFLEDLKVAINSGISPGEILCSFYAKLCYRSLTADKNSNISRVRSVADNLAGCFAHGHGAVFEHCTINFVTTNCSRVFTHELVRHRVGMAYSQTSGRYCTVEDAELVLPPEFPLPEEMGYVLEMIKDLVQSLRERLKVDSLPMSERKKLTSTLRRIMPNGCTNEIGWTANIRSLRHLIELRTNRHAEWEIRQVFNDVAELVLNKFPGILHAHEREEIDGLYEYTNLQV